MGPEIPILIACLVGLIGVFGIVMALVAKGAVIREEELVAHGIKRIHATTVNIQARPESSLHWFATEALKVDSHFGDCVLTVWEGWLVGRLPTLGELHTLAARRERRRVSARICSGITGLLVVSGIAGTLLCIHPILGSFSVIATPDGAVDSAARAGSAMTMIQSLRNAFLPSLAALFTTLFVSGFRSAYVHSASRLAWKLDQLAINVLFPMFRPRTFAEELVQVQADLKSVAAAIQTRDKQLEIVTKALTASATALVQASPTLELAAKTLASSAETSALNAKQIIAGLNLYFNSDSVLVKKLGDIEGLSETDRKSADSLKRAAEKLTLTAKISAEQLREAEVKCREAIDQIPEAMDDALAKTKASIVEAGQIIVAETGATVSKLVERASATLESAVRSVPISVAEEWKKGGDAVAAACASAAVAATTELTNQSVQAANNIHAEIAPISRTADEIRTANTELREHVVQTLDGSTQELKDSTQAALGRIEASIVESAASLDRTQASVRTSTIVAKELLTRVESLRDAPQSFTDRLFGMFRGKDGDQ